MRNIVKHKDITWIDIQDPDKEDVEYLRENFQLHPVVLEQIIPPSWGTRAEQFDSNLFFVLFFPVYSKETKETTARELDIVAGPNFLVTSHYNSILPLKAVFDECNLYEEHREKHMGKGVGFLLYHTLHRVMESVGEKVGKIGLKTTYIQGSLFDGREREMLQEISLVKADVINFWRIVRPQKGAFTSLRDDSYFGEHMVLHFSHLRNHWARIMSSIIIYRDILESLEQTNNSLLTDKTNEIVKLLTIFAVIVFPLTLISSIFGMNTDYLPFVGTPGDFWIISGIMAAGTVAMILFFKRRKWL